MRHPPEPKPLFLERMQALLPEDFEDYLERIKTDSLRSIRCNTLKISPQSLKKKLEAKGWKIKQPFKENPEVMIIENVLQPGELGRSMEHLLGYYYVQEIASMLPVIALKPKPEDLVLDLCASPGSKTTQMASAMENKGTIIANEVSIKRIQILAANLERCGATNAIITRKDGSALCRRLNEAGFEFDKILVDAPCSGEGTIRSSPKTAVMWNIHTVKKLAKIQQGLIASAIEILKVGGELVYSTCTHAPEENEAVVDFVLRNFKNMKVEILTLPVKCRPGITSWEKDKYNPEVTKSCRIYPQDNDTDGFFLAKFRRMK